METILVNEKKLEELIARSVQKHIDATLENLEELRKLPAMRLILAEDRLNTLEQRIEREMETRSEFANFGAELKEDIANLRLTLNGEIPKLNND
jgi:hypothetical protein